MRIQRSFLALAAVCLVAAGASLQSGKLRPVPGIGDFHAWTRVNQRPVPISSQLDTLCRGLIPEEAARLAGDPHMHKFIDVWVNPMGKKAMFDGGKFPEGSMIVKEKHKDFNGPVDMSTVMIKRGGGYNPTCGDWEFLTLDASGQKVTSRGRIESCMKCHRDQIGLDYTYRTYVAHPKPSAELKFRGAK
jgi:hypothetical protein